MKLLTRGRRVKLVSLYFGAEFGISSGRVRQMARDIKKLSFQKVRKRDIASGKRLYVRLLRSLELGEGTKSAVL